MAKHEHPLDTSKSFSSLGAAKCNEDGSYSTAADGRERTIARFSYPGIPDKR
jgi:hypothetical protein